RDNREFNRASSEIAELLSDVELARPLMSTPHFCDIARSVDFLSLAEERGAADIAGDAPELAVERRRSSYSPLLLSPAIGQRAGELGEGEIGRRGAVEQCRHDPG